MVEQWSLQCFFTIKQLRKTNLCTNWIYTVHFHVQVDEEWKDRDEIVPKEKETSRFVREKGR